MSTKKAFITGILGQDGFYLAELLLGKGYEVDGLALGKNDFAGLKESVAGDFFIDPKLNIHYGDVSDKHALFKIVEKTCPDEVYNLAASHMRGAATAKDFAVNTLGPLWLLEAVKTFNPRTKFFQAGSGEMYGDAPSPQNEATPFNPLTSYAVSKTASFHFTKHFRDAYGIFACNGFLFNHESPRRPDGFVTRKITQGVAEILAGKRDRIKLGNLDARRDWGYAPDYVDAMWRMLQHREPDDYVVATGELHTVREFLQEAFRLAGVSDWEKHVASDAAFFRVEGTTPIVGDAAKVKKKLGWEPKIKFKELVRIMLRADCEKLGIRF